jgi:hypothetical protein
MAIFLSKAWFKEELSALLERASTWPMPWQVKIINSLLYLREDSDEDQMRVYRRTDNQLILSMTDTGDIYLSHHGFWKTEFAFAIGEALVLLARIHQERLRLSPEKNEAKEGVCKQPPVPRHPQVECSLNLESFFDIVAATSISADLWEDSRERFADCIRWANEFESVHAHTTWDTTDYFIAIDSFTSAKLKVLCA